MKKYGEGRHPWILIHKVKEGKKSKTAKKCKFTTEQKHAAKRKIIELFKRNQDRV